MNPVALQLGPISIRWYAICIVSGLILAVYLSMKEAPRKKIDPDDIIDFIWLPFRLRLWELESITLFSNGAIIASILVRFSPSGTEELRFMVASWQVLLSSIYLS